MTKTKLHAFGAAAALLLWTGAAQAQGGHETALEVQSWCKYIINAQIEADGSFYMEYSQNNGFCWGAFAVIQNFSSVRDNKGRNILAICSPSESSRIQFIKIFDRYVTNHPETADHPFPILH